MNDLFECLLNSKVPELNKFDKPHNVLLLTTNSDMLAIKANQVEGCGVDVKKIIKINCVYPELGSHGYNPFKGKNAKDIATACLALIDQKNHDSKAYKICSIVAKTLLTLDIEITPKILAVTLNNEDKLFELRDQIKILEEDLVAESDYLDLITSYIKDGQFDLEQFKLDLEGIAGILHRISFSYVGEIFDQEENISFLESLNEQKYIFVNTTPSAKGSNYSFLNKLLISDIHTLGKKLKYGETGLISYIINQTENLYKENEEFIN